MSVFPRSLVVVLAALFLALVEAVGTGNIPVYDIPPNYSPSLSKSIGETLKSLNQANSPKFLPITDFHPLPASSVQSPGVIGRARRKRSEDDGSSAGDLVRGWKTAQDLVNEVDISEAKRNETIEPHLKGENRTAEQVRKTKCTFQTRRIRSGCQIERQNA